MLGRSFFDTERARNDGLIFSALLREVRGRQRVDCLERVFAATAKVKRPFRGLVNRWK